MSAPLNIGVIGLGRMGQLYARTLATQVSGVCLYAVADVGEQARKQVTESFGVSHAFSNANDLMALPELDAVVIATPTSPHYDMVIAAASAREAIFCKKPLALTLEETRNAFAALPLSQVKLQVGFIRRFGAG